MDPEGTHSLPVIADTVVQQINDGMPASDVARERGVHPGSVDRAWRWRVHGIRQS
ncbi:MAG: helix-turn-helix domain-containing protein [bacterium]